MRELFVEELAQITGGGGPCPDCWVTTDACCEEGPLDLCCVVQEVRSLLET
ncbi:MAG: hypothetical protein M3323_09540 [Actinomycetota bacterium]|nr:hypothetical protein [Actinomycetota bacterium]